ncbi:MAG: hypothetical protein AVDCRST_MAG27-3189 [uncultured Craurococcus sp.]|uniref:Uncharacterized protein n=1 Tax=uncultured Craurococcus sp. TaxID=1135998 RepID=A0A6J4JA40_9PROT|nr:MAG: hypothetical protein AVDCRST_MAG27-3189 [uncultured Craurococcus sp.]
MHRHLIKGQPEGRTAPWQRLVASLIRLEDAGGAGQAA